MKSFPYFAISAFLSFVLTTGFFAAIADENGVEHWLARQTSALAGLAAGMSADHG